MPIGDLCAVGSALFWSFSVILMRVAGYQIPPLPLTFFKNAVAVLCLLTISFLLGDAIFPELSLSAYFRLVVSAILGISLADTMIAAALNRLGASLQALADCAYAPVIASVGFLMFGEQLSSWEIIGGSLVVAGVFVGASMTAEIKKPRDLWVGILLAALAHIIMAVGILMVRDIFRETSITWVASFRFFVAMLAMIIWCYIKYPKSMGQTLFLGFYSPNTWRITIPMAFLGPFLATLTWIAGFKYLDAGRAAIYNQLSTVFVIILAYLFLNERLTKRKTIGICFALAGSFLVAFH